MLAAAPDASVKLGGPTERPGIDKPNGGDGGFVTGIEISDDLGDTQFSFD
jgi:hypothetical protein